MATGIEGQSSAESPHDRIAEGNGRSRRWTVLTALVLVAAGFLAYRNTFGNPFLFDDERCITSNEYVRDIWPPWRPMLAPPRTRPVVNLTLAVNYAISGYDVWSYRGFNLAIHIAAALVLFGICRRTMRSPRLIDRLGRAACPLSAAVALLWLVHPLQTSSVSYAIQRAESLMGLFYLLTLYCAIRSFASSRGRRWQVCTVVCCAVGMGCKQVMVTAPLIVLLYDRIFESGSFRRALAKRRALYGALAGTWVILWVSFGQMFTHHTVGFRLVHMKWWEYPLSQFGVILHYLRLSFWPEPLCLDYMWPIAATAADIVPPAIALSIIVGVCCWALWRRPAAGFLGAWFFGILTPSSSILPINDLAFEHRMYLSLAGLIAAIIAGGYLGCAVLLGRFAPSQRRRLWPKLAGGLAVVAIASALGAATFERNKDYASEDAMWADVVRQRPDNFRAQNNYGYIRYTKGDLAEAIKAYTTAVSLNPGYGLAHRNLGKAYLTIRRYDDAIRHLKKALELSVTGAMVFNDLAYAYYHTGRMDQAVEASRKALEIGPKLNEANYTLALALSRKGLFAEAIEHYKRAVELGFTGYDTYYNLALALSRTGAFEEAVANYREALAINADHKKAHCNLAIALHRMGKPQEALTHFLEAIRIDPDYMLAHYNLAVAYIELGREAEAVPHLERALEIQPGFAPARDDLKAIRSGRRPAGAASGDASSEQDTPAR